MKKKRSDSISECLQLGIIHMSMKDLKYTNNFSCRAQTTSYKSYNNVLTNKNFHDTHTCFHK